MKTRRFKYVCLSVILSGILSLASLSMQNTPESEKESPDRMGFKSSLLHWVVVRFVALGILLIPAPVGVTPQSWRLLAIFAATITGSIARPIAASGGVLLGVS